MTLREHSGDEIIGCIERWVSDVVVRHKFCPFAKPALDSDSVSYTVLDGADSSAVLQQVAERVSALFDAGNEDATELLILANAAKSFDDFLDLGALADAFIESMGWHDQIQLATFHPDYCFADTSPNSLENYTNRAPWPVIQLLQVESVGRAIDRVGDTDSIPARNIDLLNNMDDASAERLMANSCPPSTASDVSRH